MNKIICILLLLQSCGSDTSADYEKEKKAILQLEKAQREYHFQKNAEAFSGILSDSFLSINKGVVSMPSKKENYGRFSSYFSSVKFIKWDDAKEPVIRFSNDASIAYVTVQKEVITEQTGENGGIVIDTTHFAWLSIYKKGTDGWKIDCVASTNK